MSLGGLGALGGSGLLFTQAWVDELKASPEAGMVASVQVWRNNGEPVYDGATNTYTQDKTMLYEGKARVQPMQSAGDRMQPGDSTVVQRVLFSLPIAQTLGVDFRTSNQGRVTSAPLNPGLCKFQYVLQEIMDSSNPIERTLIFVVNQEQQV